MLRWKLTCPVLTAKTKIGSTPMCPKLGRNAWAQSATHDLSDSPECHTVYMQNMSTVSRRIRRVVRRISTYTRRLAVGSKAIIWTRE